MGAMTPAKRDSNDSREDGMMTEKATFGAGCFWGVEASFRELPGVLNATSGYAGGHMENPTYKDVCTDRTGHAEVVEVEFDPAQITYDQLLQAFWNLHDPTQVNRQGPDHGTQYRTVIFFHSPEQEETAKASKQRLAESGKFSRPIATAIEPAQTFYPAEEYHQQYLAKRGLRHCHI
jgi:peptide-methionine (S)-S-oxide reductase